MATAETGGAFSLFEDLLTKGKTTPLHQHAETDEVLYLVDGELLLSVNGEEHRLTTGGVAVIPRGTPHALLVTSDTARLLCLGTSSSTEAFFRAASDAVGSDDAAGPVDFGRVRAAAIETGGMDMLGPPPFAKP
ncbi:MAG TPA: cupin domain-containing protein [Kofleriaceae bacterium]|nr:cupin domain-containing protein [Kofleriaceae bacterium]